jgi:hypothetical protein
MPIPRAAKQDFAIALPTEKIQEDAAASRSGRVDTTRGVSRIVQRLAGTKRLNSSTQFCTTTMCADSVEESKPGASLITRKR